VLRVGLTPTQLRHPHLAANGRGMAPWDTKLYLADMIGDRNRHSARIAIHDWLVALVGRR